MLILLLISFVTMLAQGFLGIASWSILFSNWMLSGVISFILGWALNHQRLSNDSNPFSFVKAWVILTAVMNTSAGYLPESLPFWKVDLLLLVMTLLALSAVYIWQVTDIPLISIGVGVLIGIASVIYAPAVFWVVIAVSAAVQLQSSSIRNSCCLLTGLLTAIWILYCVTFLCVGHEEGDALLRSLLDEWDDFGFYFPSVVSTKSYTGWLLMALVVGLMVIYMVIGPFKGYYSSLRLRSGFMMLSCECLIMLLLMPSCWNLYIALGTLPIMMHQLIAASERNTSSLNRTTLLIIGCFMALTIGEPILTRVIHWVVNFEFSLPEFSLPDFSFEMPFDIDWPW